MFSSFDDVIGLILLGIADGLKGYEGQPGNQGGGGGLGGYEGQPGHQGGPNHN